MKKQRRMNQKKIRKEQRKHEKNQTMGGEGKRLENEEILKKGKQKTRKARPMGREKLLDNDQIIKKKHRREDENVPAFIWICNLSFFLSKIKKLNMS